MKDMEKYGNKTNFVWVNVASSVHVLQQFINLDNHLFVRLTGIYGFFKWIFPAKYRPMIEAFVNAKKKAVLIKHDCRKKLPFPAESVDHVLCSHFLEHVFPEEMELIVADFHRVMKSGGTLHVIVPDLDLLAKQYLDNKKKDISNAADIFLNETLLSREKRGSFIYRFLEFVGGFGLQHYWMYDYASLASRLDRCGFDVVGENISPSQNYRLNDGSLHILVRKRAHGA